MSAVVGALQSAARSLLNEIRQAELAEADARQSAMDELDRKKVASAKLYEINEHLLSLGREPVQRPTMPAKMPLLGNDPHTDDTDKGN